MDKERNKTGNVAQQELLAAGASRPLAARLYAPPAPAGLIVFFPGGRFMECELDESRCFLDELAARTGWAVLGVSYTTAGISPFPAAAEDAHAVLRWTRRERRRLGWNGKLLVVAGIEAGGNLAAVAALMANDRGGPVLAGQMLFMPMLDPGQTSCSMSSVDDRLAERAAAACAQGYRGYLPGALDRVHPYASPLQSSRIRELPPALILSAEDDPLRDEARLYGVKLQAAGVHVVLRQLPPVGLGSPHARSSCTRKESALHEMAGFLDQLRLKRCRA